MHRRRKLRAKFLEVLEQYEITQHALSESGGQGGGVHVSPIA